MNTYIQQNSYLTYCKCFIPCRKHTERSTKNFYMEKMAVGPKAKGHIDITKPLKENIINVAKALGKDVEDMTVTILERDRHKDHIAQCRQLGCRIKLFRDGDVGAAIATALEDSGIDMMVGIGGAPEGVLAAAALKCLGGEIQGRLHLGITLLSR